MATAFSSFMELTIGDTKILSMASGSFSQTNKRTELAYGISGRASAIGLYQQYYGYSINVSAFVPIDGQTFTLGMIDPNGNSQIKIALNTPDLSGVNSVFENGFYLFTGVGAGAFDLSASPNSPIITNFGFNAIDMVEYTP